MIAIFEKLAAANIELLPAPGSGTHFLFARDGFAALVERTWDGFGSIGAPGLITDRGLAMLVWRGPDAFFVTKSFEGPASDENVEAMRCFARDLAEALEPGVKAIHRSH